MVAQVDTAPTVAAEIMTTTILDSRLVPRTAVLVGILAPLTALTEQAPDTAPTEQVHTTDEAIQEPMVWDLPMV